MTPPTRVKQNVPFADQWELGCISTQQIQWLRSPTPDALSLACKEAGLTYISLKLATRHNYSSLMIMIGYFSLKIFVHRIIYVKLNVIIKSSVSGRLQSFLLLIISIATGKTL